MAVTGYEMVVAKVAAARERSGREDDVTVVAVSKAKSAEDVMEVYEMGHRDFGENRAQELADKAPKLPSDIRWHFVGALQTNKTRLVRPVISLLHSMDRRSLALAWLKGMGAPPPVLLQVNIGDEPQKSGVTVDEVPATLEMLAGMGIELRGLMTIPPLGENAEESRRHFRRLRSMRDDLVADHQGLVELSMGMTDDYEVAVEEGASIIRVGRAIFGPRK